MASSRRAQVRSLLSSRSGVLVDRAESYLAAVDLWAGQGNARVLQRVGPGLVAVCCWLASESLDSPHLTRSAAERASGLTPIQFRNAERDLRAAVSGIGQSSPTTSPTPSTPSRRSSSTSSALGTLSHRSASGLATSTPTKRKLDDVAAAGFSPSDRSPEALRAKAQAAQAGTLFARVPSRDPTPSSNLSTPRTTRFQDHFKARAMHTPTKSSPLKQQRFVEDIAAAASVGAIAHFTAAVARSEGATTPTADGVRANAGAEEAGWESNYAADPNGDLPEPPVVREGTRTKRLRSMRNLVTGLGSAARTPRLDAAELQARLDLLRQRLAPLLDSADDAGVDKCHDLAATEGDLFVWVPLQRA